MRRSRALLLVSSLTIVLILLGSGAALTAGAGEGTFKQMLLFSEVLSFAMDNYVDPVDADKLMHGAYEGLMSGLDAHGAYLSPDEVAAWKRGPSADDVADPGVSVLKSGPVVQVVAVAAGSPAEGNGIAPGDQIRKIDGRSVRSMSLDQAQRLLRGVAGSSVELDLLRVKDLKREVVKIARAARRGAPFVLDVTGAVAVLKVRDLDRLPNEALAQELVAVRDRGVDRVLVDLRDAASADTRHAAAVAELFAGGELLKLKDRAGRAVETISAQRPKPAWSGKVGVLVNGGTAGAGEGLAMILQDRSRATIFGESTYGLGTEPKLIELPEGGGLLVPGFVWETAGGKRWNTDGIVPDKVVKADARPTDGDDEQLKKALDEFGKTEVTEAAPKAA
ncbi:MAG TPA: S41 family peptidase [Candidatus Polarisedimenticolaceae bacterium]|nr:S41 family peptidase [Candidatus Polarisedimenticolaceae bacterium]